MTNPTGGGPRILVLDRSHDLAERVLAAVEDLEPVPEVVVRSALTPAEQAALRGGSTVLVAGPSMLSRAGLRQLASVHRRAPSAALVLVVEDALEANLREIVQVGADDAVPLGATDDELCLSLERVLALARRRSGTTEASKTPAVGGRVITVASPTEGCGKTFLAANIALFLAREAGARVVLVDLDLQFGEVRTALRAKADFTLVDAVRSEAEGHTLDAILPELLARHSSGFSILAAPRDPSEADSIEAADVTRIIEALRTQADYVVVDTPGGLAEHVLAALDATDHLLAVATPDRPSVHNLAVFLKTLDRLGVGGDVTLMLNKAEADADLGEAAARLPRVLTAILPYDREVARSINLGVPLLEGAPSSAAGQELLGVLDRLFPTPAGAARSARSRRRVFGGRRPAPVPIPPPLPVDAEIDAEPAGGLHAEELPPFLSEAAPLLDAADAPRSTGSPRPRPGRSSGHGRRPRTARPGRPPSMRRPPDSPGRRETAPRRARQSRAPPRVGRYRPTRPPRKGD